MKIQILKIIVLIGIFVLLLFATEAYSQNPAYTITITNDNQVDDKNYEFDIYLLKTGANTFEYANNSQYFININPAIKNGGTLSFTILSGTCQLNAVQQIPSNKVSFDAVNNRLRVAAQSPSGAGTGTIIPNSAPGTRLGRFRVTNTVSFAASQSNLTWYNFNSGFFTKVFSYVGGINTEITDSTKHFININNSPLPVILISFTSSVAGNSVGLNWVTQSEMNNKGFTVQRYSAKDTSWKSIGFVPGNGTINHLEKYFFEDIKLSVGLYNYRLQQIDYNGNLATFNLANNVTIGAPANFVVSQNYPNPSNPKCRIDYQIPSDGKVTIKVYDLLGREVVTLVDESKQAGYYTAEFDGTNLASGIYIYRIKTGTFSDTKKMVLVK